MFFVFLLLCLNASDQNDWSCQGTATFHGNFGGSVAVYADIVPHHTLGWVTTALNDGIFEEIELESKPFSARR